MEEGMERGGGGDGAEQSGGRRGHGRGAMKICENEKHKGVHEQQRERKNMRKSKIKGNKSSHIACRDRGDSCHH